LHHDDVISQIIDLLLAVAADPLLWSLGAFKSLIRLAAVLLLAFKPAQLWFGGCILNIVRLGLLGDI